MWIREIKCLGKGSEKVRGKIVILQELGAKM